MYSKKTFLSTALDSRKYKGYSTTLPESHVPTIWAFKHEFILSNFIK